MPATSGPIRSHSSSAISVMRSARDSVIRRRSVRFDSTSATSSIPFRVCWSAPRHKHDGGASISASAKRFDSWVMSMVRRLVHALVIVLTLVIGAAAAAIIVSQTAWFKNWLRGYIVREAKQYLNGTLTIERLGGNLFFGIEMENIGVSMDGRQVVAVKDLGLDYNVFELVSRGLSVDNIRLDHPIVYLRREGDTWSLSRLIKKQEQ